MYKKKDWKGRIFSRQRINIIKESVISMRLVAFFSSSGETKEVAQWIAKETGDDIYEIKLAKPYTEADLNYLDPDSRCAMEMNDPACRPILAGKVDAEVYDTVLLGFPIWFYAAPRAINSFLESADFSGKKIIPFCTSGMGGLKEAVAALRAQYPSLDIEEGKCFANTDPEDVVKAWAATL